jgi:hypothetical protein
VPLPWLLRAEDSDHAVVMHSSHPNTLVTFLSCSLRWALVTPLSQSATGWTVLCAVACMTVEAAL